MSQSMPPPPPPPPLPPYVPRGPAKKPAAQAQRKPPAGSLGIGIETEVLLRGRNRPPANENTFPRFARRCAALYNSTVNSKFPRMHSLVQNQWAGVPHTQWVLHHDPTCETEAEPWGIEIISPLLRAYPGSTWRDDVNALWNFLHQTYIMSGGANCSTHVHISRAEDFTVSDLKRIAQAVIHFESAFEVLVPQERRANEYARSNWLDNPRFAYKNLSRDQSIDLLEGLTTTDQVLDTMNPSQSKYFGWNFLSIKRYKTIEFRRGSVSLSADDTFMWVELAISFIKAAWTPHSPAQLRQYPRTIGGLRTFIQHAQLSMKPGTHDQSYFDRLFDGKSLNARLDPIPVGNLSPEKQEKLQKKIKADSTSNPVLDMISSAQQYGAV